VKVKLASDQLAAGFVEDAGNELAAAARLDPENPELLILQARVCLARGDHYSAQRLLESADPQAPQRAEIEYFLGIIQQQRLQWDRAYEHFVRATDANPHEVAYLVATVEALLQLGDAEQARAFLQSHEDAFGWTPAFHAALAECCEQLGDRATAATAWEKVVDAEDDPHVRERLALSLCRSARWTEAITHLHLLLNDASSPPPAHLRLALAECLLETDQASEAHEQLTWILRDQPDNATALQLMARTFAQQGSFERASQIAERALLLTPDEPRAIELAAALALKAGRNDRALLLARKIDPRIRGVDSPVAEQIIAQLSPADTAPGK
jgi:tetratricopeptide (TPR) repeat protein